MSDIADRAQALRSAADEVVHQQYLLSEAFRRAPGAPVSVAVSAAVRAQIYETQILLEAVSSVLERTLADLRALGGL